MPFLPGQSGNPKGRARGAVGGRSAALGLLDSILGEERNKQILRCKLQQKFEANPYIFFRQIVMPLLPRESLVKMETAERAPVRIIFEQEAKLE